MGFAALSSGLRAASPKTESRRGESCRGWSEWAMVAMVDPRERGRLRESA